MLLFSEIQYSTKRELYLQGFISQAEYNELINNYSRDTYLKTVSGMNEFWDGKIIDYHKCIRFLRMNLYVCSNIISIIGNKRTVVRKEEIIEDSVQDVETIEEQFVEEVVEDVEEVIEEDYEETEVEIQESNESDINEDQYHDENDYDEDDYDEDDYEYEEYDYDPKYDEDIDYDEYDKYYDEK